jgi:hypothetical protein
MLFPTTTGYAVKKTVVPEPSGVVTFFRAALAMVLIMLFAITGVMAGLLIKGMNLHLPKLPIKW